MNELKDYPLTAKIAGYFTQTIRARSESAAIAAFLEEMGLVLDKALIVDGLDLHLTSDVARVPDKAK